MSCNEISSIWPEWLVEKKLGKGSFGTVYKVFRNDNNITTYAAIKVIPIPSDSSEIDSIRSEGLDIEGTRAYLRGIVDGVVSEIKLMESLKGVQNIVSVEDYKVVESQDGIGWLIFIRMELLTPLGTHFENNGYTENDVIKLGCDICTALELCAQRGIIHRDIKPENIFVNDFGFYKLGDFGVARTMANSTGGLSQKGTPFYMSPEVFSSVNYDARADIYSLGLVMYKLLNDNYLPFLTKDTVTNPIARTSSIERRRNGEQLPAPCNASDAMKNIILRACAFNPDCRFATAGEMKQALLAAQNGTYVPVNLDDLEKTCAVNRAAAVTTNIANEHIAAKNTVRKGKNKKGILSKIITVFIILLILAGVGTGGFFAFKWYTSPEQRIYRALDVGDYDAAEDAYNEYYGDNTDKMVTKVAENIDKIKEEYNTDKKDYETAIADLDALSTFDQDGIEKAKEYINNLSKSKKAYAQAEKHYENEDYASAMIEYGKVTEDDINYANAVTKLSSSKENYIKSVIEQADTYIAEENYTDAIKTVNEALVILPEEKKFLSKLEEAQNKNVVKQKAEILEEAQGYADKGDYVAALTTIQNALAVYPDDKQLKEKLDEYKEAKADAEKAEALEKAQDYADDEDYDTAISVMEDIIKTYPGDEALEEKLDEYREAKTNAEKEAVLSDAENKAKKKDYLGAYSIIKEALGNGNDKDLENALETYRKKIISESTDKAEELSDDGDHLGALREINGTIEIVGEDAALENAAKTYKDAYTESIIDQVDEYIAENDIASAKALMETVADEIADEKAIKDKQKELDKYKTTLLHTLVPLNGGFTWNDGAPQDPVGSDFSRITNYTILHADSHKRDKTYSAHYKIDSKYSTLSMNITPYKDAHNGVKSFVQVYANSELVYSSPMISQTTGIIHADIDVSYANYFEIIVVTKGYGCIMLTDVSLNTIPNYKSDKDTSVLQLEKLSPFNGSLPWNSNEHPDDIFGNSYTEAQGYSILHADSHKRSKQYSAEYNLKKEYIDFEFSVAPYIDFGENAQSYIKVYVDDELRYTSPVITQKTKKFCSDKIDLKNAEYMKVIVEVSGYGCIIMSDALLTIAK